MRLLFYLVLIKIQHILSLKMEKDLLIIIIQTTLLFLELMIFVLFKIVTWKMNQFLTNHLFQFWGNLMNLHFNMVHYNQLNILQEVHILL